MQELNLKLTLDDVNVVLAALGKLPLEVSVVAFGKIKAQAEAQIQPAEPAAE